MSSRRADAAILAGILASAILALALPVQAAPLLPEARQAQSAYTLYGDATSGWGTSATALSRPGPTVYVYAGDNVTLTLYSADRAPHNWFIDFNGDNSPSSGEPSSPDFSSPTTPLEWNFTAPADRTGIWTYKCKYHVTTMTGQIVILSPRTITLYGSATDGGGFTAGWGTTNATVTEPGPTLFLLLGAEVTLHLISADGQPHTWFIAYDNGTAPVSGEPSSPRFQSAPIDYPFTPDRAGTFTYRCGIHPTQMNGTVVIVGGAARPPAPGLGLIPTIMAGTIAVVLFLAVVYQARAVRAARRAK